MHGHLVGDDVLVRNARILMSNTRTIDTVGRWGGEECLIVISDSNLGEAAQLAQKIHREFEARDFPFARKKTASFGVTSVMQDDDVVKMVSRAGERLRVKPLSLDRFSRNARQAASK